MGKKNPPSFTRRRTRGLELRKAVHDAELKTGEVLSVETLMVMEEAQTYFLKKFRAVRDDPDKEDKARQYALDMVNVAAILAPYKYPKFATLKVIGTDKSENFDLPAGASKEDILKSLVSEMVAFGLIPKAHAAKLIEHGPAIQDG